MLFVCVLIAGFISVGRALRLKENHPDEQFLIWTLGAILFAHAATMISVSYFDQSIIFLYLVLAAIGSVLAAALAEAKPGNQTGQFENETEGVTVPHYG
jgi:multidrug transporter EmrE-like cation transporter